MRKRAVCIIMLAFVTVAFARLIFEFKGWDDLIDNSPDIFIAKRADPLPVYPTNHPIAITSDNGGAPCSVEIVSVLKGDAKAGPAQLWLSDDFREGLLPRRGQIFLTFVSNGESGTNAWYKAVESYRTVPIAPDLYASAWTNALAGKTLKEQIKKILLNRRDALKAELERVQEESKRIELGIQELKD